MGKIVVNAMGELCPIPVVKATRALREMTEPGTLEVHVDNEISVQNLSRMATGYKLAARSEKLSGREFVVSMEVTNPIGETPLEEPPLSCGPDTREDLVVAVDSAALGRGGDEVGTAVMKGFLFAVSQLPKLPAAMLFYNGGAHLTCRGSDSLEDLKTLEAQGVGILTCGTCLNHYGLTEELAVGNVTNMYAIVEKLAGAGKVIRP